MICIPDLQLQSGWDFEFSLVPREQTFFAASDYFLFSLQIVERENESPVEVALPCQWPQ